MTPEGEQYSADLDLWLRWIPQVRQRPPQNHVEKNSCWPKNIHEFGEINQPNNACISEMSRETGCTVQNIIHSDVIVKYQYSAR